MAKNLIPEVCKLLGVEVDESFKIKNDGYDDIYRIGEAGNIYYIDKVTGAWCITFNFKIVDLINGKKEIVKLPWKPKDGKRYWSFGINALTSPTTWSVNDNFWRNDPFDVALFEKGWVYRTCEEAKTALPKVAAEMGVEYEV